VSAADWAYPAPDQPALSYVADFGLRFWYGRSNTS